jgi:uncharacterized protein YbbK (DUF523 family)
MRKGGLMIGVSACLVGLNCTYRGDSNCVSQLKKLYEEGKCVTICPEVLGGLSTPRDPSEIVCEDPLTIKTCHGVDVTEAYLKGAKKALEILEKNHIDTVILKANSPSCGVGHIYDGTFSHTLVAQDGVTVRLLKAHGITVKTEKDL